MTPLHWSAFHNKPKHCSALLKAGAHPRAFDYEGKTALHWSCSAKGAACAKALLDFDPGLVNLPDARCSFFDRNVPLGCSLLLPVGAVTCVKTLKAQKQTPLHMSVGEKATEITTIFVKQEGVNLDAQDQTDRTPLMWAAALGDVRCIVFGWRQQYLVWRRSTSTAVLHDWQAYATSKHSKQLFGPHGSRYRLSPTV
jgi:ankyrin repeat protein